MKKYVHGFMKFNTIYFLQKLNYDLKYNICNKMSYLYCITNVSMPGIVKVGITEKTPENLLHEANTSDTWPPPTPYKIEFAKKIYITGDKEKALHLLLEEYTERLTPHGKFFRVSPEKVLMFFDIIDGEMLQFI